MQKLTVGMAGNTVSPALWLDACAKMMTTTIVLLNDKVNDAFCWSSDLLFWNEQNYLSTI